MHASHVAAHGFHAHTLRPSPLVTLQVSGSKLLHQPVDLLGLAREPKPLQEGTQGRHKVPPTEVQLVHIAIHHLLVEACIFSQELTHLGLPGSGEINPRVVLLGEI